MWTSKITAIQKSQGKVSVAVEYTNGTEIIGETLVSSGSVDMNWLLGQVKNRVAQINSAYTFADTLSINQALDTTPVAPPVPTQADTDFSNFQKWMNLVIALNSAKQLGFITGAEPMVTDVKTKVLALAAVNLPKLFT